MNTEEPTGAELLQAKDDAWSERMKAWFEWIDAYPSEGPAYSAKFYEAVDKFNAAELALQEYKDKK